MRRRCYEVDMQDQNEQLTSRRNVGNYTRCFYSYLEYDWDILLPETKLGKKISVFDNICFLQFKVDSF